MVTTVANLGLGSLVLVKGLKETTAQSFFWFTIAISGWTITNYLTDFAAEPQLNQLFASLAFGTAWLAIYLMYIFSESFRTGKNYNFILGFVIAVTGFTLSVSSLVVGPISIRSDGVDVSPGPFYLLYILSLVIMFGGISNNLVRIVRKSTDRRKVGQAKLILWGAVISFVVGVTTNGILPVIFSDWRIAKVGPLLTVALVGTVAFAIVRHQLFDIRLIIARALAYVASLGFVVGLYALIIYLLSRTLLLPAEDISINRQIVDVVVAVFVAFSLTPVRKVFDRITRRLFFRDDYSPQEVLNELGALLATEINLSSIVTKSSEIIANAIKPSSIRFVVFKDAETFIDKATNVKKSRAVLRPEVDSVDGILITREDASSKERSYLRMYDADILLKLRTNEETVGVILFGPKQSGTTYPKQDTDLLRIIESSLAIAVQNSRYFEQIQEFNVKLQKEVEQATSQLRTSNKKLKALDEAKDEFISMASHQLRTPLTSIKGYISMVTDGDAGAIKPEQKRLLDEAFASSQRMVYLIADLLNVSRLRTGKFLIEPSEVHLPDIVEQEINQLKPTAKSRRLKLTFNKPARFPTVMLDETKMRQVVMNFIDNAIYYTPAGGHIEISLMAKKDTIEYTVKDDGIGVPKEDQPKLFTKFFRAGNARKSRPDGTGLGLYMAQRVVSAQGGSIIFKSAADKGSIFGFSFPLKKISTKKSKK